MLDRVPKKQQAEARALLCAMPYAETRQEAEEQRDSFIERFGNAYPDAAKILRADWERMVTFYGFPKSTGSTCARPILSSHPSRPCACEQRRRSALRRSPTRRR